MFTHVCIIYIRRAVIWCKYQAFVWDVIFYKAISRSGLRYNVLRDLICIFFPIERIERKRELSITNGCTYVEFVRPQREENLSNELTVERNDRIPEISSIRLVRFDSFALSKRVADCDALNTGRAVRTEILLSIYIKLTFLIFIMLSSRGEIEITTPL